MFPQSNLLQSALAVLDSAQPAPAVRLDEVDGDMIADEASSYALKTVAMQAAAMVQGWCETGDDLAEGEGLGDRLMMMLVGVADENKDGELTEEESAVLAVAMNEAWSYMAAKGVSESDLDALFNAEDPEVYNGAAARVCEFLTDALPDGDEAALDEIDDFAFGSDAQAGVFDAVYKKRFSIRNGRKVIKRVRVSGTVRLSSKQKVAIRKAGMKSRSAKAMVKRMKSVRVRKSMGMKSMSR
jgi:hypothetical protein